MRGPEDPPLGGFAWIVCHSSAGKDSQTALRRTLEAVDAQGVDRSRVVVSHQDLGEMEWPGTKDLARLQAAAHGLRFEVTRYRDRSGGEPTLLDYVRKRRKWPSNSQRFCTSEFKRGPGNRLLTALSRERPGPILQVFGFRAEESPARAKKKVLAADARASTGRKPVTNWLPIHGWTEDEVWEDIHASGIPYHPAYDLGMTRLSCRFCIFAPPGQLLVSARNNPGLFAEYLSLEEEIGHTFKNGQSLAGIARMLDEGREAPVDDGAWNM